MKITKSALWKILAFTLMISMMLTSCATPAAQQAAPTAQVIRETVQVEVTKQVEVVKTVQVEVTKEVQVQVTPTAAAGAGPKLNPDVSGNVEFWHFWASPVRRNGVRRLAAICQAKTPKITVSDTVKPFGDIWTANVAAVAGGSGMPDVIVSDRPTLPKDAADGVYMDLQELATRDGVTRDQFYGWAWDQTLYKDHTYGIPFETDVRVLFWNKQAFTAAGLDPEKPPKTWSELWTYADKLDKKDAKGNYTQIAFFPLWNAGFSPFWAYLNGAPLISPDGKPMLNDPKAVEAMTWIKKWVDRYGGWQKLQEYKTSFGAAPPNDLFMSGHVAMLADIYGYNSQLQFYRPQVLGPDGKSKVRMEWGVGMLPYNDTAGPADWSGGFSLSIPTGAKNVDAAWEFIKCVTGPEGQASWARDTYAQPTNLIAAKDPALLADPTWKVVDEALKVSTGGVFVQKYPNWNEQLDKVYEDVWNAKKTPQQALDEAQKAIEDQLAK